MNPRAINNLSKNMSINEEYLPESMGLAAKRLRAEGPHEQVPNFSKFDEVSMGSISSFEEGRGQPGYRAR